MENASKALIIAGAILISILIIAIGMYIYTSSTGSIESAISSMDTQEIEAFNSMWSNYEGEQTGAQVKAMINKLIGHANTYQEEKDKVIAIACQPTSKTADNKHITYNADANEFAFVKFGNTNVNPVNQTTLTNYIKELNNLYTTIEAKHNYNVKLDFNGTALLRRIIVEY